MSNNSKIVDPEEDGQLEEIPREIRTICEKYGSKVDNDSDELSDALAEANSIDYSSMDMEQLQQEVKRLNAMEKKTEQMLKDLEKSSKDASKFRRTYDLDEASEDVTSVEALIQSDLRSTFYEVLSEARRVAEKNERNLQKQ